LPQLATPISPHVKLNILRDERKIQLCVKHSSCVQTKNKDRNKRHMQYEH
jgi:hypothetical protein